MPESLGVIGICSYPRTILGKVSASSPALIGRDLALTVGSCLGQGSQALRRSRYSRAWVMPSEKLPLKRSMFPHSKVTITIMSAGSYLTAHITFVMVFVVEASPFHAMYRRMWCSVSSESGPRNACRLDQSASYGLDTALVEKEVKPVSQMSFLSSLPLRSPPSMSPCPLYPSTLSAFPETEQTDLRPEEPHLRLRHGLHHKRHADCGQPDPAERHGVAASSHHAAASPLPAHAHALRADSVPPEKQIWTQWHSSVKNPRLQGNRCCKATSSPWQGHKRAVLNALMVLFPNAINSQEFRMIASTTCRNSEDKLHFHLGIPMAIQADGVREQERGVNTQSPPHPILSTHWATGHP